jgi:hypothetical protein
VLEHAVLNLLRQHWRRDTAQLDEARLLERNRRQVHPRRSAHLVLAVHVIDVLPRFLRNPLVCQRDQRLSLAEGHDLPRTRRHASRLLPARDPVETELALADLRRERVVIVVRRQLHRAGDHAVTAADAFPWVVSNAPFVSSPARRRCMRYARGLLQ